MTKEEKLAKAKELMGEAYRLMAEANIGAEEVPEVNPIQPYLNAVEIDAWASDSQFPGAVRHLAPDEGWYPEEKDYCALYPSEYYARVATAMKRVMDLQLAFKWSCDKDFYPDWENEAQPKFYIVFNTKTRKFHPTVTKVDIHGAVHFSKGEYASACAGWLNENYRGIFTCSEVFANHQCSD